MYESVRRSYGARLFQWPGDRQTDGQNHDSQDPNSIAASRGKKVAINDTLPLKAARRDAIAKLNFLGVRI